MQIQFSAKLDIMFANPTDYNQWEIMAYVVDNTGNFFAGNASIGDIVYLDGSMLGLQVLRYRIKSIDYERLDGTELYATLEWDMGSEEPIEPYVGLIGLIGQATDKLKICAIPSITINMLDESFVNSIKNYENLLIVDNLAPTDSPEFTGKPLAPTADINSNDLQIANTEWVNDKIENIDNVRSYIAKEDIGPFKILYIDENQNVGLANCNNIEHADRIIGVSLQTKLAGEPIDIVLKGEIQCNEWNFSEIGDLIFVGIDGEITLNPSEITGFIQQIGIIADNNTIVLDIEEAVLL